MCWPGELIEGGRDACTYPDAFLYQVVLVTFQLNLQPVGLYLILFFDTVNPGQVWIAFRIFIVELL